jgi:D-xylose transport system permease protein
MSSTPEQAAPPLPEEIKAPAWLDVLRRVVQGDLASLRVFVVLAVIWAIFQFENSHFLTAQNLSNLFLQITAVGLISVGVVYVLLLGEIDLSVGAVSGLAAAIMAVLNVKHGWSPYTAIAAGVIAGLVIGLVQGFFFTQFGIPSFVVTLAGLLVWQGALLKVLGSTGTVNITDGKITGLANHFYSHTFGWIVAAIVIAIYAGGTLLAWRRRVTAGLADQQLTGPVVRIVLVAAATIAAIAIATDGGADEDRWWRFAARLLPHPRLRFCPRSRARTADRSSPSTIDATSIADLAALPLSRSGQAASGV